MSIHVISNGTNVSYSPKLLRDSTIIYTRRTERVVDEILSLIQRVKTKSQEQHEGKTQHERYAHGEIASTSIEASLDICNGWKIQKQLKKEKATN